MGTLSIVSWDWSIICFVVVLLIAAIDFVYTFKKLKSKPEDVEKMFNDLENEQKGQRLRLPRTTESTVFESLCAILLIITWADVAFHWNSIKETQSLMIGNIVGSLCIVLVLGLAYRPDQLNFPMRITRLSQYVVLAQSARVIAVELSLMFAILSFDMVRAGTYGSVAVSALVIVMFFTIGVYMWKIRRV